MDILGDYPGLCGLFIAGVFSAALSSLSTCLNSMAAVVLEDFVKPFARKPLSQCAKNWIIRFVVIGMGGYCMGMVVVVQKLGTVLQLTMSLEAISNGPLLGVFSLGILMPWINANVKHNVTFYRWVEKHIFLPLFQSALIGGIVGVLAMSWVSLNAQWAIASGAIKYGSKQTSIENCTYNFGESTVSTIAITTLSNSEE